MITLETIIYFCGASFIIGLILAFLKGAGELNAEYDRQTEEFLKGKGVYKSCQSDNKNVSCQKEEKT